jgi:hypothetical protein
MSAVSYDTEKKLRDAMQRLLTGTAKRTDGRLIKNNLYIEAGVSRATMNRAAEVITEWNAAVGNESTPRDAELIRLGETVSKLRNSVAKLREENTALKRNNQAAVTVIAELHAQLQSARGEEPIGTVTPLTRSRVPRTRWRS